MIRATTPLVFVSALLLLTSGCLTDESGERRSPSTRTNDTPCVAECRERRDTCSTHCEGMLGTPTADRQRVDCLNSCAEAFGTCSGACP